MGPLLCFQGVTFPSNTVRERGFFLLWAMLLDLPRKLVQSSRKPVPPERGELSEHTA